MVNFIEFIFEKSNSNFDKDGEAWDHQVPIRTIPEELLSAEGERATVFGENMPAGRLLMPRNWPSTHMNMGDSNWTREVIIKK